VLIAGFVVIERRTRAPLVPIPGIFRLRSIRGINITALLIAMSLFSMFFFISLYMQQVLGYSPLKAGVSYLPLAVGIIISAGLASTLVTRFGVKPVLVTGLVLVAGGLVWFAQISVGGSYLSDILGPSLLSAFGLGFAFVPMTVAAVAGVEPHESGLASGLINTSQQVGGALGLAILAAVSDSRRDSLLHSAHALPVALVDGFRVALTVGAGFAVFGALLALLLVSGGSAAPDTEPGDAEAVPAAA
jgi:predicted MFS family arabinose efflux permease